MTLISYDAAFHIKDLIDSRSLLFAQSEACPPLLLSPSSFGHESGGKQVPRHRQGETLISGAFAFAT